MHSVLSFPTWAQSNFEYSSQAELDPQGNVYVSSDEGKLIKMAGSGHCSEVIVAADKQTVGCAVMRADLSWAQLEIYLSQVREQAALYKAKVILIEDQASGTQLIQELIQEGVPGITRYATKMDKVMRLHSVTSTIENGLMFVPEKAPWLEVYLHELMTFPKAKFDDQADSTSQALDWAKGRGTEHGLIVQWREDARAIWVREGRLDEVRAQDEKYGPLRDRPAASQNVLRQPFASFSLGFSRRT